MCKSWFQQENIDLANT
uniref:Uncharacterized protein n=1 Tax=Rhizophora mucronata TaxID=61149 RepID=A0A2P2Q1L5_RHIMU